MLIRFSVFGSDQKPRGNAAVRLNWDDMTWKVTESAPGFWMVLAANAAGRFQVLQDGKLGLFDGNTQLLELLNAPNGRFDAFKPKAGGAITGAIDGTLVGLRVEWQVDVIDALFPATLTPFREHLLRRLNSLLPAPYLSKQYDELTGSLRRDDPGVKGATGVYTSCGSMPGFVVAEMGRFKGLKGKPLSDYINTYSLNGTNIVRIKGKRFNCWTENDLQKRPQKGDIYALLNRGETDKALSGISHVGVIQDCSGDQWMTMDLGQGSGFDGKKDQQRHYKADTGELYGETNQGGGYRVLAGWVDVDEYLKLG